MLDQTIGIFASLSQSVVKGALQVYTRRFRPDAEVVYRAERSNSRGRTEPPLKLHVFLPPETDVVEEEEGENGVVVVSKKGAGGAGGGEEGGVEATTTTTTTTTRATSSKRLRPCVVLFFGGAWIIGAPQHFFRLAHDIARTNGCVCVCAEYRLKTVGSPHITPHDSTADALEVFDFLTRVDAPCAPAEWRVDRSCVLLGGASAGGQLAATVAFSVVQYDRSLRRRLVQGVGLSAEQDRIAFGPSLEEDAKFYGWDKAEGARRPRGIRALLLFGAVTALSVVGEGEEEKQKQKEEEEEEKKKKKEKKEKKKRFEDRFAPRGDDGGAAAAAAAAAEAAAARAKEEQDHKKKSKRSVNIFEAGAQSVADWFLSDGLLGGQDSGEYISPMRRWFRISYFVFRISSEAITVGCCTAILTTSLLSCAPVTALLPTRVRQTFSRL